MKKLTLVGTQGTGKTTLLNALSELEMFSDHKIIFSRRLDLAYDLDVTKNGYKDFGFDLGVGKSDAIDLFSVMYHAYALKHHDKFISDRCLLDVLAYTKADHIRGTVNDATLDFIEKLVERDIKSYDAIFLIEPEFELEENGIRPSGEEFQEEIRAIIDEYLTKFNMTYHKLSGSVENRVNQVIEYVNKNSISRSA